MFLHVSVILSTGDVASHIARGFCIGVGSASGRGLHPIGSGGLGRPRPKIHEILQDMVNERAVCILLECFLILEKI